MNSLFQDGIVLKPINGHRMNHIFKYFVEDNILYFEFLRNKKTGKVNSGLINIPLIIKHWRKITNSKDQVLLMPFFENLKGLPDSSGTLTIRVITSKNMKSELIKVKHAWFEVPIFDNYFLFFDTKGKVLNFLKSFSNIKVRRQIEVWSNVIKNNHFLKKNLIGSFKSSISLHKQISNIDTVAWDWISSNENPILLEGNSNYGLFIPQILEQIGGYTYNNDYDYDS